MDNRQIARNGDLLATINVRFDRCQRTVDIDVHAPDKLSFQGNRIAFQKLLAVVRMALLSNCKKIKNVRIAGKVNNNIVYHACINAENKWYLIDNHTKKQDMKKLPASLKGLDQLNGLSTDPKYSNLNLKAAAKDRSNEILPIVLKKFKQEMIDIPVSSGGLKKIEARIKYARSILQFYLAEQTSTFNEIADARKKAIISALSQDTINKYISMGTSYEDVMTILQQAENDITILNQKGIIQDGSEIYSAAVNRGETLAQEGYSAFAQSLKNLDNTQENIYILQSNADEYNKMAKLMPSFSSYAETSLNQVDVIEKALCMNIFSQTGINQNKSEELILGIDGTVPLYEFVCVLSKNGYRVKDSSGWMNFNISVENPDGIKTEIILKQDKISSGEQALVGYKIKKEDSFKKITIVEWQEYANKTMTPLVTGIPDEKGITDCDRLAADPYDLKKNTEGIALGDIKIDLAVEACMLAVEHDPENPRMYFQLGRAMSVAGDEEASLEFLSLAANSGYSPAAYYLGEIFLVEDDDKGFFDISMAYYKDAADGGYKPAKEVVSDFSDYFEERTFNSSGFSRGSFLEKLILGKKVSKNTDNRRYLTGIITAFEINCGEPEDAIVRNAYEKLEAKEVRGYEGLFNFLSNPNPWQELPNLAEEFTASKVGERDAESFIRRYSCWGYLPNRLNEGLVKYALNKEIILDDMTGRSK
ncbi:MAG: sel1 repeat family protein [Alphaproteobacteria bacterium]|nr:sel1 repeat family protein [Alphaproteobacteria bacterium]